VIEQAPGDTVVVLAGDHIYKMDYQPFVAAHRRHRADVTIAVRRVPLADATRMGILALDDNDRIVEWHEKPRQPKSDLASMGVYVFSKRALHQWLSDTRTDFGHNVIPAMIEGGARVYGYRFDGYWQDVGTVQSYWRPTWRSSRMPPSWISTTESGSSTLGPRSGRLRRSEPPPGPPQPHQPWLRHQRIRGQLRPLARRRRGRWAVVRDSIVLFDSVIRPAR